MHQDPWEPPDGSNPADQNREDDANDTRLPSGASADAREEGGRVPSPLLNWQVLEQYTEIEGEATLIDETLADEVATDGLGAVQVRRPQRSSHDGGGRGGRDHRGAIRDHRDDVVVAEMAERRAVVLPGEAAAFEVSVANHGRWSALFEVTVEGWIDEAWTPDLPLRVQLEPGTRQVVTVTVQPPRRPESRAGEHALAVVVRAARYPGRVTRMAATLVIERFAGLKLGAPQPSDLEVSWFAPTASLRLPVTNLSNYAATIQLQGMDRVRGCDFTFHTDGYAGAYAGPNALDAGTLGAAQLTLEPGQTVTVPVEIRSRQRSWIGVLPRVTDFRLVARMETEPPLRRAVNGEVAVTPLIGPWHLAVAGVLAVVAIFGTGLAGLALLVALRSTSPVQSVAQPVATVAPAPPVVTFVIQMDQPMPTRMPSDDGSVAVVPSGASGAQSAETTVNAVPQIPVVRADQITAPGEPTRVGQAPLQPIVVTTPGAASQTPEVSAPSVVVGPGQGGVSQGSPSPGGNPTMTYGQMFKDVAGQFDLDWRVLAAQAYLESGFDSLALSGQGDMGLMQIRPGTWNDWSPTVAASDPFDAYSNVLVGAAYLNFLRGELSARGLPEQQWMLVAYNWGPDKVFNHVEAGGTWESLDPARRQYADDVLRIAASIPPS